MQDQTAAQIQEQIERIKKQLSRGDVRKTCSENIQQIYKRTSMLKCLFMGDFMVWLFSSKFVVGFRNTFSKHLWNLILTAHRSMRNVSYV